MLKLLVRLILLMGPVLAHAKGPDCTEIPSMWDSARFGQRFVQYDSSLCYGFALTHALIIYNGGQYVNPIDLSQRLQRVLTGAYSVSPLEMVDGADARQLTGSNITGTLMGGVCTQPPSDSSSRLLSMNPSSPAQWAQYRQLLEGIAAQCDGKRVAISVPRIVDMGFRPNAPITATTEQALHGLDMILDRGGVAVLGSLMRLFDSKGVGSHAVTVVGRRPGVTSCEYLILDSQSTQWCEQHTDAISDKNCAEGLLWVSADAIRQYGTTIIGFLKR